MVPDGKTIFCIDQDENLKSVLYSQSADAGTARKKLRELVGRSWGLSLAPDGKSLAYATYLGSRYKIYMLRLDAPGSGSAIPFNSSNTYAPAISPDGHWIATGTVEWGSPEVYVNSHPSVRVQISSGGGWDGMWSGDGKTVFYRSLTAEIDYQLVVAPNWRVELERKLLAARP